MPAPLLESKMRRRNNLHQPSSTKSWSLVAGAALLAMTYFILHLAPSNGGGIRVVKDDGPEKTPSKQQTDLKRRAEKSRKESLKQEQQVELTSLTVAETVQIMPPQRRCYHEEGADYYGQVVLKDGPSNILNSVGECCEACQALDQCNIFVFCNSNDGCSGGGYKFGECWLKREENVDLLKPYANRSPGIGWTSGVSCLEEDYNAALAAVTAAEDSENARLASLKAEERLPLVFFDVEIQNVPIGRIEMVLYPDISPRAAENFRQLCTGEHSPKHHFKGASFYRIIDQFIDQFGVEVESVYGGQFKDDQGGLNLTHDYKGLLSMANMGPDTNTAHTSIMMGPAHHLDGHYTIFGQVVSGFDVVDAINKLSVGKPENTADASAGAKIVESGQLRQGSIVPDLDKP